ncbi:hypothetical protein VC83_02969 [Pseudogymnoascus destructans]|uniref:CWH43-like N-terminal domain-containing protein n=1 Tax=Pseudogymnoascus destructans TaxID=655981 RepID=A0A177AEK2_9PEZI|nr:uncharacterized protein VC83_02969 [Pseudogymnoascus destructans]OAF60240.1 hypothetical protein VC83_02969 [Pseudogymnoascus destructans]
MWGFLYWVFPVVSGLTWLGMLIAMLVVWTTSGRPHYPSMEPPQSIAYISDVGAQGLKPLFIAGSVVMTVFLDLSLVAERWLRHRGRLARNRTMTEKAFMFLSMLGAIMDTLRHPHMHNRFLVVFIVGYVVSAIFICAEYQRLGIHFREHRVLRASFWIKLFFIIIEVALAIGFGVESKKDNFDTAAVLEWTIAFIFTFYILSIFIDLIPAVRTKERVREETALQMEANDPHTRMHEDEARLHQAQYDSPSYRGDGSRLGQNF